MGILSSLGETIGNLIGNTSQARKALEVISWQTGFKLVVARKTGGVLEVPFEGEVYEVVIISLNDMTARISIHSKVQFQAGRLPQGVRKAVQEMNRTLENCRYGESHCGSFSVFHVESWVAVMDLSPGMFLRLFKDLIQPVQVLDRLLTKYGYQSI